MYGAGEGRLLDGRFAVEGLVGRGGMGDVHRGTDRVSHRAVAIKFLRNVEAEQVKRFNREAALLLDLEHPAIVRYILHGVAEDGRPYLAMEWLEGETLEARLARGPLSTADALALAACLVEGLAVAHARGILHRDLKPSNLMLVGGMVDGAKILDFGIAKRMRQGHESSSLIQTRGWLGTPAYMSPEQASGATRLRPSTDVFSLGAVLYECLAGTRAFQGADMLAVIAAICLQEPARLCWLRPEVPTSLEWLVTRMLSKSEALRPQDAGELQRELAELDLNLPRPTRTTSIPAALVGSEQRVLTLVLIAGLADFESADSESQAGAGVTSVTLDDGPDDERRRATPFGQVEMLLEPYGGRLERLLGGVLIVCFTGTTALTDLAARASRFALEVTSALATARVAICTGRAMPNEPLSVGALVDEGAPMLADARPGVKVDAATADLVRTRFVVDRTPGATVLVSEREAADVLRTLLGRPTPFVGRQRELDSVIAIFEACEDESVAHAALVIAPPGTGKSRLCHEAIHALRSRGKHFELLVGRGDAVHVGAPFGVLSSVVRSTAGIVRDDDVATRQRKLRARFGSPAGVNAPIAVEFLGEMAGVYFPDDTNPELRSARQDPRLMGERMRAVWLEWLAAELSRQPVVLVLEDVHWGDLPSVQHVDAALRQMSERPLFVLALGRPEVLECFPRLWDGRRLEHLRLLPLTNKASVDLVRNVLGEQVDAPLVDRIVSRAEGSPFFLEELVRAVEAGRADALPDGVMATIQARLDVLGPDAGRVLRAASVFGEVFSADGIAALIGATPERVEEKLDGLERREVVTARPNTHEYAFRHALVRESCYAALTEEDRVLGHRLAGEWLEARDEADPSALAEHFDRGAETRRAAGFYQRAALQALQGDDWEAAGARAARGIACGAAGETLARLRLVQANISLRRGHLAETERLAIEALGDPPRGSAPWFHALRLLIEAVAEQGKPRLNWVQMAESAAPTEGAETARVACLSWMAAAIVEEDFEYARVLLGQCGDESALRLLDPWTGVRFHLARVPCHLTVGAVSDALSDCHAALALARECGDVEQACAVELDMGIVWAVTGLAAEAVELGQRCLAEATRRQYTYALTPAHHVLGYAYSELGEHDLARAHFLAEIQLADPLGNRPRAALARTCLSRVSYAIGAFGEAESLARSAVDALDAVPRGWRAMPLTGLARALFALGRHDEALTFVQQALSISDRLTVASLLDPFVKVTAAEILWGTGDRGAAQRAVAEARDGIFRTAERIVDPHHRAGFLRIEWHVNAVRLGVEWGVGAG